MRFRGNLGAILICISLMAKNANTCSCTYWPFILLFRNICPFQLGRVYFFKFFICSRYWPSDESLAKLFLYVVSSLCWLFPLLYGSFFNLVWSHLLILGILFYVIVILSRKSLPAPMSSSVLPILSTNGFFSVLTFSYVIHFGFSNYMMRLALASVFCWV